MITGQPVATAGTTWWTIRFRGWLKAVLLSHMDVTRPDSQLARELLEILGSEDEIFDSDYDEGLGKNPPSMLLLNCDD